MALVENDLREFPNFGAALRHYRENIAERLRRYVPGRLPDIQLSAKEVVTCMRAADYPISQAAFSDIEQGMYLPKDPERFLEKVITCLALDKDSPEYRNLLDHLMRDILIQRLGAESAEVYWNQVREARKKQGSLTDPTST